MLAQGVTNIRDMGNSAEFINYKEKRLTRIRFWGRMWTVIFPGFIDKAGPMAAPTGRIGKKNLDEALNAVSGL
jgi:hypothetical protein